MRAQAKACFKAQDKQEKQAPSGLPPGQNQGSSVDAERITEQEATDQRIAAPPERASAAAEGVAVAAEAPHQTAAGDQHATNMGAHVGGAVEARTNTDSTELSKTTHAVVADRPYEGINKAVPFEVVKEAEKAVAVTNCADELLSVVKTRVENRVTTKEVQVILDIRNFHTVSIYNY